MTNPLRNRKRVRALRRGPDGSAFQNCDGCGVSVPVALIDMHECQVKKDVKRFKGKCDRPPVVKKSNISEEPRSAFHFFMESYTKTCDGGDMIEVDREAFEKWKTMTTKEQWPYILQAEKVEKAYMEALNQEVEQMSQEDDDEADSAMVTKFAQQHFQDYESSEHSGSYHSYWSEDCEGSEAYDRNKVLPWHWK